ncbi:Nicotinamidase-related amidase [Lachnospiraceae bacterium XBB1006]|nr:Nicotinamidase-related amidase [Lachnospiraceae bacterium XBB1006]
MILLVMDIQKGITDERLYEFERFQKNTLTILEAARKNKLEVIYVQHDDGPGSGFSIGDEDFAIAEYIAPKGDEKRFVKKEGSCFSNPEFADYLESLGDKHLMIIGLMTNFCVDATVRAADERDFFIVLPEGANSTFDNDYMDAETTYKYYNEMIWPGTYADCVSLEDALAMIEAAKR